MLHIYIGFQATKFYCFPRLKPPLPPPPNFYCFLSSSSSSSSFYCFPPPPPHFYCFSSSSSSFYCFLSFAYSFHFFFSTRFYIRLPTAIFSSLCSNVSCREQQSWFSSAVSLLPCLSAPVSFKDSYSKTTTCTSPSLIQYTIYSWDTFLSPKKISGYCCNIRMLYLTWLDQMSLSKQRRKSLFKRVVVLLKMY